MRLWKFGETVVTFSIKDSYYSMEDVFPDDIDDLEYDNFKIAFGITAYDGNEESIEDERYGRIYARFETWGLGGEQFQEINTHPCTDEELGFHGGNSESSFFPIH